MNSACDCVTNREPMPDVTNADAAPSGIDHFFFLDTPNAVRPRSARVPDAPRRVVVNSLSPRERADVMPLPEAVSELTLNDDALNAVLFGNNWASG